MPLGHNNGLTRSQRRLLSKYAGAVGGGPSALVKLGGVSEGIRSDLALALGSFGTPAEKYLFIEAEVAIVMNITGLALMRLGYVRQAMAVEARDAWPLVREFPLFIGMRSHMESLGNSDAFDSGEFLTADSTVMLVVWYSAFGGDEPRSIWDLKSSGAECLEAFRWLLLARKRLEPERFGKHTGSPTLAAR